MHARMLSHSVVSDSAVPWSVTYQAPQSMGILELRRGIQDASCVGPGKANLPLELRRKAGCMHAYVHWW